MVVNGPLRQEELFGDLLIGQLVTDELNDFYFAFTNRATAGLSLLRSQHRYRGFSFRSIHWRGIVCNKAFLRAQLLWKPQVLLFRRSLEHSLLHQLRAYSLRNLHLRSWRVQAREDLDVLQGLSLSKLDRRFLPTYSPNDDIEFFSSELFRHFNAI